VIEEFKKTDKDLYVEVRRNISFDKRFERCLFVYDDEFEEDMMKCHGRREGWELQSWLEHRARWSVKRYSEVEGKR